MLKIGDQAPDFELPDGTLQSLLTQGPVIVYFYPADFTPGCTREACSLRDMHDDLTSAGLRIIGVSPQNEESHQKFKEKHDLPFTLVADTNKEIVRAWDVDGPLGFGVRRASFLVGKDGVIADAILADFRIDRHTEFFKRAADLND